MARVQGVMSRVKKIVGLRRIYRVGSQSPGYACLRKRWRRRREDVA
jgi:hypothetical protein